MGIITSKMDALAEFLNQHWPGLAAAIGITGGGGLGLKKLVDKEQNKKIKELRKEMDRVKIEVNENSLLDKELKEDIKRQFTDIKGAIGKLQDGQLEILKIIANK